MYTVLHTFWAPKFGQTRFSSFWLDLPRPYNACIHMNGYPESKGGRDNSVFQYLLISGTDFFVQLLCMAHKYCCGNVAESSTFPMTSQLLRKIFEQPIFCFVTTHNHAASSFWFGIVSLLHVKVSPYSNKIQNRCCPQFLCLLCTYTYITSKAIKAARSGLLAFFVAFILHA